MLDEILSSLKGAFSSLLMTEGGGSFTDFLGMFFNTPKTFKPANFGYNNPTAYNFTPKILKTLLDVSYGVDDFRRSMPPSYYEYIDYEHRELLTDYYLRIGDSIFTIPPDFIMVNSTSQTDKQVAVRQRNTVKTKHGYRRREVIVTLYFTNLHQINGIEVKSPFDYAYYVDGLRPLLAQFMLTPFLPIENEYLNIDMNIHNVALSQIQVATVPGFPDTLQATLVLEEFNATPYIEAPNVYYNEHIDWDLFRFYYQRLLREQDNYQFFLKPVSNKYSLSGEFSLHCLKQEALEGEFKGKEKTQYNTDLRGDDNYELFLSNNDNIVITELSFSMSNILPSLQLADHESPTFQYLGGNDVTFTISLETTDRKVIDKINELEVKTQHLARNYREFNGIGYIKADNELLALTGTKYIMIDEIKIATTPEQADLFKIDIQCVSYDMGQKDREDLKSFLPFDGTASKNQAISQSMEGLYTKIKQDLYAERKMMEIELYPDLFLPTYKEINEAIPKIREFRNINNINQISYDKYLPPSSIVPVEGANSVYEKYVDPDFYVFYPIGFSDIADDVLSVYNVQKVKPQTTVAPDNEFGDELPAVVNEGGIIDWNATFKSIFGSNDSSSSNGGSNTTVTATGSRGEFLKVAEAQFGKPYKLVSDAVGPNYFDCSGLVIYSLRQVGVNTGSNRTHWNIYTNLCTPITKEQLKPGDVCVRNGGTGGGHIAIVDGPNSTIEAMGTNYGVRHGTINGRFQYYGRLKDLYDDAPSSSGVADFKKLQDTNTTNTVLTTSSSSVTSSGTISLDKIRTYLQGKNSILAEEPYCSTIYNTAVKYGINPALMFAITGAEQSFVKKTDKNAKKIANNPYNVYHSWYEYNTNIADAAGIAARTIINLSKGRPDGEDPVLYLSRRYVASGDSNERAWTKNVHTFMKEMGADNGVGSFSPGSATVTSTPVSTYQWKKNENAGKTYNNQADDYTEEMAKGFGKPLYVKSPLETTYDRGANIAPSINKKAFANILSGNYINTMSVDMCQYSAHGRMLKAFPTYVFMLLDDSNAWLDGRKLWTNYYIYKSLIDINIYQSDENPTHTATINLTNVYENLSKVPSLESTWTSIMKDSEITAVSKMFYQYFGIMPGGAKLTKDMVDFKTKLFDHIAINPGTRVHIRLGYGSNPMNLPICFNGTIAEVELGDVISIVAQSDGVELVNNVLSSDQKATNSLTNLQSEPSDIIASILGDRENWFLNSLNKDWFEANKYGIEHFGTPIAGGNNHKQQYDILKNVYLGVYEPRHYCNNTVTNIDGEDNVNLFLFNRVPWDAFQLCAQSIPEFVCQPMYHQFDSRIFYGLPYWPCSYRYDLDADNKDIKEYVKAFSQIHYIDSTNSIIDNQIRVSCTNLKTNVIATYSRGGKIVTTPVLYADRYIDWAKQKTKIIDTTVMQDYVGWDWGLEKLGIKVGKNSAIRVGTSSIIDSFKKCYEGIIMILGDASIKPCDLIILNDMYSKMFGNTVVREVVHSLGVSTGFTTSITPGIIGGSTDHKSGLANINKSLLGYAGSAAIIHHVKKVGTELLNKTSAAASGAKISATVSKTKSAMSAAKNLSTLAFDGLKSCKFLNDASYIKNLQGAITGVKNIGGITNAVADGILLVFKGIKSGGLLALNAVPGLGTIAYFLITTVLINGVLEFITDQIAYNNMVNIYPLLHKNKPFIAGVNGQAKLMPGFGETPEDEKNKPNDPAKVKEEES